MFMLCLVGMCHAPAPPHHWLLPRANSCRALCPNPTVPTLSNRTSDPDTLSILSLLTFPYSPDALAIPLSSPHPPSPILATFTSMTCVLKRFPLTSPRKLSLPCVKWSFLRTQSLTELHNYPHVHPRCRSAMFILCLAVMWHAPHLRPAAMHLHQAFPFSSF